MTETTRAGQDGAMDGELARPRVPVSESAPARDDAAAFRRLYDDNHAFVWRSVLHLGVPDASADDAVQEVFVVVHRRWSDYQPSQPLRAWLWGIARLVVQNQKRALAREGRRRDALRADRTDAAPSPERSHELGFVREVLLGMDEPMRDVLVLSDVEGMTAPEIASALGDNVNTIYSRLRIARQKFADIVRRRGQAPGEER